MNQYTLAAKIVLAMKEVSQVATEKGGIYVASAKSFSESLKMAVVNHCDGVTFQEVEGIFDIWADENWSSEVYENNLRFREDYKWDSKIISKMAIASVVIK